MKTAKIEFDTSKNVFKGIVDGKTVATRKTRESIIKCLETKFDAKVDAADSEAVVAEPKEYFSVEERFQFIEQFTTLVAKKIVPSFIITGSGGIGKTTTVNKTLKKLGLKEDTIGSMGQSDYIVFKGYSTAKALYRMLYENNGKVIVFDDCDSVFKDPIAANVLKSALDSGETRVISWGAESLFGDDLPSRFEFTGRVIFISNLPLKKFPQALISRSLLTDLTLTTEETVERIETILNEVDAPKTEKADALEFIRKYAKQFTDLNVRSGMTVLKLRGALGKSFSRIALYTVTAGA